MSLTHSNISIFVPHIGCPNKCSFCNQRYITGANKAPRAEDVDKAVAAAIGGRAFKSVFRRQLYGNKPLLYDRSFKSGGKIC